MTKKKQYQSPFIQVSRMEMEGALAVNTVHGSSHEGFSEDTSFHPIIDTIHRFRHNTVKTVCLQRQVQTKRA